MADVSNSTPETASERFKRRDASRSILERWLTGGFGAEQSGERPDLANPAEQPVRTRLADVTPRPKFLPIPADEGSLSQGIPAHQRIESTLFLYLEMARHWQDIAEAEREKRRKFFTPSQFLNAR